MAKILVIDDNTDLLNLVETGLAEEDFEVIGAAEGRLGLRLAYEEHPDLVILDLMLPEIDGFELCHRLRELTDVPIIMLTALSEEHDVVRGLSMGADDYIVKPFNMAELVARIKANLRRHNTSGDSIKSKVIELEELKIDFARRKTYVRDEAVDLTPIEFRLLSYLARNCGYVLPHERILGEVWGPEYREQLDYLRLYISYLRRKIEVDPSDPQIIKTERGVGYYIDG